jgi:D-glycero-D-manno-heptose 1,7-bisphosphate phosphatase
VRRAVFLDRDGVLVAEGPLGWHGPSALQLLPGAVAATARLHAAGFLLVVVTNQPVVARGQMTEEELSEAHRRLCDQIRAGGGAIDAVETCPHHPDADLEGYRVDCQCRKPRPGLLLTAAARLGIDLQRSYMVGDRRTDIEAGRKAGCRTIQVMTGLPDAPRIRTTEPPDPAPPDAVVADIAAAAEHILAAP